MDFPLKVLQCTLGMHPMLYASVLRLSSLWLSELQPVVALFFLSPHSVAVLLVSCVTSHLLFHFRQRGAVHRVSLHFYMNQNWLLRSAANRSWGHFHWRKITAGRICGLRPPIVVQFVSTGVSVFDFGPKDLMVDCWFHPFDTNTSFLKNENNTTGDNYK